MTISIQSSSAALIALETLNSQTGPAAGAASSPLLDSSSGADPSSSDTVLLSGGAAAAALGGLSGGLADSASIADAAVSAGNVIEGLLARMRQDAISASDPSAGDDARAALDSGFKTDLAKIQAAIAGATVGGVNLIDGSSTSAVGQSATLTPVNLSLGGPLIGLSPSASLASPSDAEALAAQLGTAIDNVGKAIGQISAQGQAIQDHLSLIAQAGLSLSSGGDSSGALDQDGARLAALQIQQQLSQTGASIGNQTPQAILSLFR
jgi:flagellin-like hook-associated protein FlgL